MCAKILYLREAAKLCSTGERQSIITWCSERQKCLLNYTLIPVVWNAGMSISYQSMSSVILSASSFQRTTMCSPKQAAINACPTWNFDVIFFNCPTVFLWATVGNPCKEVFAFSPSEQQSTYVLLRVATQPSVSMWWSYYILLFGIHAKKRYLCIALRGVFTSERQSNYISLQIFTQFSVSIWWLAGTVNVHLRSKNLRLDSDAVSLWYSTLALVLTTVDDGLPHCLTHRSTRIICVLSHSLWFSIFCVPQGGCWMRAFEISAIQVVHLTMTLLFGTNIYLWRHIIVKLENMNITEERMYSHDWQIMCIVSRIKMTAYMAA